MGVTNAAMKPVQLDRTAVGRLSRMDSLQNQSLSRNLQEREQVKLAHQCLRGPRGAGSGTHSRLITHHDVSADDIEAAGAAVLKVMGKS